MVRKDWYDIIEPDPAAIRAILQLPPEPEPEFNPDILPPEPTFSCNMCCTSGMTREEYKNHKCTHTVQPQPKTQILSCPECGTVVATVVEGSLCDDCVLDIPVNSVREVTYHEFKARTN